MRTRLHEWPTWIGHVTAAWCLVLAACGIGWALGMPGYPFGVGDPEMVAEGRRALDANVLALSTPAVAGPVLAVLGVVGAAVASAMARGAGSGASRRLLLGSAVLAALVLGIGIQDYRPLVVVAYTPVLLVGKVFFGWPEGHGFGDLYTWPRVALTVCLLAAVAWALTAVAYRRRTAGACGACGRTGRAGRSGLQRWAVPAVTVAVVIPLLYAATRWLWALGVPLGVDAEMFREGQESGLWLAGATLATSAAVGAVLTLGLVQRWGEVFPRWVVGLRGRRVPPALAVVPATLVAALVTSAGTMYVRLVAVDGIAGNWATHGPETLWPVWGAALFVAAMAYRERRRGPCTACGRGQVREPAEARPGGKA
ncbi:hypothetical protein ACFUMH_13065 [Cellulomonas sp. NPDC057328]|uniref:hypothetical protein n=1 Tax=Cellulomonas sp. NPDC057328 TaxID=3346101 RepID=UPI003643424C